MSTTQMLTTNALTVKLWAKEDFLQVAQESVFGHFMNSGAVYIPPEVGMAAKGDQVTFAYVGKGTGKAIGEGGTLAGNEEALELRSHSMVWNVQRYGFKNPNDEDTIEALRTHVDFEQNSRRAIKNRFVEWIDTAFFQHMAGADPTSLTVDGTTYSTATEKLVNIYGHNTPVAPSTNRIIRANNQASDQALTSSDKMSLKLVDYALEKARLSTQKIGMLSGNTYDLFVSPEQEIDLRHDTTGAIQWYTNQLARVQGGKSSAIEDRFENNMVALGKYQNVNIYSHPRVAYGVNGSNSTVITTVRRAVLVGRDALSFASPMGGRLTDSNVPIKYKTELQDYEYYKGIEGRLIWGLKKMQPSSKEDIGTMVISTYAAAHTS